MRILLLGEYSGDLDEGMRKVSSYLAQELRKRHEVLTLDLRDVFTNSFWREAKVFDPEIIQHIHGPSIKSFALMKVLSLYCRRAKTMVLAIHPIFSFFARRFIPLFKVDLVFVQSFETERMFQKLGCTTRFVPCGVDIKRFMPATVSIKEQLREKYKLGKEKFVVLHIGSIKEDRNVQLLMGLQSKDIQVLIVGALSTGGSETLKRQLEEAGCLVWARYFENIEEIYALADCYIFPTPLENIMNSIETPLSVLEAMSCNLPVVTTRFGALPRIFEEGDGLFFVDKEEDLLERLETIKDGTKVRTREKVLPYAWENVASKLEEIYEELIANKE